MTMTSAAQMREESRRETTIAVIASILLHLLLIGGVAFVLTLPDPPVPPTPEEEPVMELTIVPPEPSVPATPQYVRTSAANAVEEEQKDAPFESDNSTRAASEAPPSGPDAMPSTEGREAPSIELEDRNYTAGMRPAQAAPPSAAQEAQPAPKPEPETPVEEEPQRPVQIALRQAPPPKPRQDPKPEAQPARPAPAQPPAAPGYQPETRITRIRGNISNRGRASVQANATPLGRYKKAIADAIGSRWYYYVNNQIGLLNIGTVDVRFVVMPDGKVRDVRVMSNSSNESFASVSVSSIVEAEIPPIPEEVAKLLDNGRIEIDYSFTILSN